MGEILSAYVPYRSVKCRFADFGNVLLHGHTRITPIFLANVEWYIISLQTETEEMEALGGVACI